MLNIIGKRVVLNHCIISIVLYLLSCWRPQEEDLKQFVTLCRNFLQGEDPWIKRMAIVK